MWRPLARRASLYRRARSRTVLHSQVPNHESVNLRVPSFHSASRFCLLSVKSNFHQNSRFFSSSSAENYEDPPTVPPISGADEGFDFSVMNEFDGNVKSEFENEDSIFDVAVDNTDLENSFGGSVAFDGSLDSVAVEDESSGPVKINDREKLEALLSLLMSSHTGEGSLESNFEKLNLVIDEELVLKVLKEPSELDESYIIFLRWAMKKKPEFKLTKPVVDALIDPFFVGELNELWDFIKEVREKEKGVVSTDNLNKLLSHLTETREGKLALDIFDKFEDLGCVLNSDTYYLTIEALFKTGFHKSIRSVCEKMISADMLPDAKKVGKIMRILCKGRNEKGAYLLYKYAKDKEVRPPLPSICYIVSYLSRIKVNVKGSDKEIDKEHDRENVSLALELLNDYSAEDRKQGYNAFTSVIKKLCWIEDFDSANKLLLEMIKSGPPPGNTAFNCVINGLAKEDNMKEALNLVKLMESRGLKPDLYTYTVIMSGYASGGEMEEACKIFEEAKKKHSKLSAVSFHSLIRGYCKIEQFDKAVSLLKEMKQHGLKPNHDEYNKLIKSLCLKALDWETAAKLEEEMKVDGVILNGRTSALIRAVKELKEGTELSAID